MQFGNSSTLSSAFTGVIILASSATLASAFLCSFILYYANTKSRKIKTIMMLVILNVGLILGHFLLGLLQVPLTLLT